MADLYNSGNGLAFASFAGQGGGGGGGGGPVTGSFMPMRILTDLIAPKKVKFEEGLDVFSQKVTSVAAGTVSSDAINLGQLTDLSSSVISYVSGDGSALQGNLNTVSGAIKAYIDAQDAAQDAATSAISSSIKSYIDAADMAQDQATAQFSSSLKNYVDAADSAFQSNLDAVSGTIKSYVDAADFAQDQAMAQMSGAMAGELASEYLRATMAETDLSGALSAEVARAEAAESQLTTDLGAEVSRAQAAEGTIQSNIDGEVTRAQGVEATLSGAIAAETVRATGVESDLSGALAAESVRAQAAEVVLQGNIDTQAGRLDAILSGSTVDLDSFKEIVDLINTVDTANSASFASYVLSNNAAIHTLSGALDTLISDEVSRATAAEGVISADLATEASDRQTADAAMVTAYDSLRYVETGSLVAGSVVVSLATQGANFAVAEMTNIALDAMVDYDNTGYTNSLVAVKMFSEGGVLKVQIDAPAYETAKYRLIVVNKKKGGLV
jgi:hypothetical protein